MSDEWTAMTHEYDGGQCWCGPKCEPVEWLPVSSAEDTDLADVRASGWWSVDRARPTERTETT